MSFCLSNYCVLFLDLCAAKVVSSSVVGHQTSFKSRDSHGNVKSPLHHLSARSNVTKFS